jgi:hypothetical protein
METSRSLPQQTAQIFSPLAGQNLSALRFSQIGQITAAPGQTNANQQSTPATIKNQNR